jgi:hypothetical protein
MRSSLFTASATGAVIAFGLIAVPALASTSTTTRPGVRITTGAATGTTGSDSRLDSSAELVQGTLTADQKVRLAGMAEEEKLAQDVYLRLASSTGDIRFTRIAASETNHLTQIRTLLTRYGIADPTAGMANGQFASQTVQKLHDDLVARGSVSLNAALAVGRDIETLDIADLATAGAGVTAEDVITVYARLTEGSQSHLRAFGG